MKKNITKEKFIQEFTDYGRADNFSPSGLEALYDYLIEETTLDVIRICCEYSEYPNLEDCLADFGGDSLACLQKRTTVIEYDGGIIIQNF